MIRNLNSKLKKQDFWTTWRCLSLCFYFVIGLLCGLYKHTIFIWCSERGPSEKETPNNKYLVELIKRRTKVQEKDMSCECA